MAEGGEDYAQEGGEEEYDDHYGPFVVRAIYDYTAEEEGHISFKYGDMITVLEERDGGWWKGEVDGQQGLFPANYVQFLEEEEEEGGGEWEGEGGEWEGEGEWEGGEWEGEGGEGEGVELGAASSTNVDASPEAGHSNAEEESSAQKAQERKERRQKEEEELEELRKQLEEEKIAKADLEREVEQLKLVKEHTVEELAGMRMVRSDVISLAQDLIKLMTELDEESGGMLELQEARQSLQEELSGFNTTITKEIKKGSPLEPFKGEIQSKLAQLKLKLDDDDKFNGIYEKKKRNFYLTLRQIKEALEHQL